MIKFLIEWMYGKENVVEVKIEPTILDISQPVISIIEELKNVDAWEVDRVRACYYLDHIKTSKRIGFTMYEVSNSALDEPEHIFLCHQQWVTPDESRALGVAFKNYLTLRAQKDKELRLKDLQEERQKYIDAFVKEKV